MKLNRTKILASIFALALCGCASEEIPAGVQPVTEFKIDAYLGTWYEIARLDHSFERGLSQVTADYSKQDDGSIRVINKGFDAETQEWDEAEGKAFFVDAPEVAHLKVSFFGPFYSSYVVFDLDKEYQHALVSGPDHSYLWILSRTPDLNKAPLSKLVEKAKTAGFDTGQLIYPEAYAVKTQ